MVAEVLVQSVKMHLECAVALKVEVLVLLANRSQTNPFI